MRAVTFGTATRDLGGLRPRLVPSSLYQINSPPINSQCTNHCIVIWWSAALRFLCAD